MKQIKWLTLVTFIAAFIFGCSKNNNDTLVTNPITTNLVTVQKGVVTFPTIQSYLTVTENKKGEQAMLNTQLQNQHFVALKATPSTSNDKTITPSAMPTISTTAFNPALYSGYLLSVLNADKIISLNGYYVKVDMDNVFCSFIDQAQPNAYNDLNNNTFSNANIMSFLHPDEPVIEVLDQMRNGQLTWASYQDQLARKGGQGICLKRGKNEEVNTKFDNIGQYYIVTRVGYYRGFISFSVDVWSYSRWQFGTYSNAAIPTTRGYFEWEGVCKNSGKGNYEVTGVPRDNYVVGYNVYSGGSALKTAKMTATTTAVYSSQPPVTGSLVTTGY